MFELQTGGQRGFGAPQLLGRRLFRGEPVLELVPRPSESAREAVVRVADHPAEELRRNTQSADLRGKSRRAPVGRDTSRGPPGGRGRGSGGGAPARRADQQGPHDVGATTLVLLLAL